MWPGKRKAPAPFDSTPPDGKTSTRRKRENNKKTQGMKKNKRAGMRKEYP
jgi:hypothetical protein